MCLINLRVIAGDSFAGFAHLYMTTFWPINVNRVLASRCRCHRRCDTNQNHLFKKISELISYK
jgi:enterochelin esterase-like enzyme